MRLGAWFWIGTFLLALTTVAKCGKAAADEDDFSEFDDDFEEDLAFRNKDKAPKPKKEPDFEEIDDVKEPIAEPKPVEPEQPKKPREVKETLDDDEEVMVEDDDFDGIDDDEFEDETIELGGGGGKKRDREPKLTITPVPMPGRGGLQAYWAELLMLTGISVYLLNYVMGRYKNQKIAQVFFESHWKLLEENFHLLGDNGSKVEEELGSRDYVRMSDSLFQMWCSGRVCCEGMLVELKLLKRQDIVAIISNIFRPAKDVFRFTVEFAKEDMDSIVFALATKKTALKISKEYNDLINYCPDKKPADKFGLSNQFVIMSEMTEVISSILDQRTASVINKCAPYIDSIHITDQFTGTKTAEPEMTKEGVVKAPEPKRFIIFTFVLPTNMSGNNIEAAVEEVQPLLPLVLYTVDRFKRIRLSKEGKIKADKNRAKVEEAFMKQTHQARADALAARKEEKRRLEKERILQEEDPEKQRRWEEKEQKREKKKKQPKLKQLKVKAM